MKMMKVLASLLAVLLLLSACGTPAPQNAQGSSTTTTTTNPPATTDSRSIEEILCQAFKDQYDSDFDIAWLDYIGSYEGIHLAIFHTTAWSVQTTENIGGYPFVTGDSSPVSVYMDGKIMPLKNAYEQKLIDDDLIRELFHLYYLDYSGGYNSYEHMLYLYWYDRSPLYQEYYEQTGEALFPEYDIWPEYTDSYKGTILALINDPLLDNGEDPVVEEVAGFSFQYPGDTALVLYRYGKNYSLTEAYTGNWIDEAGIEALYNKYIEMYPDRVVK